MSAQTSINSAVISECGQYRYTLSRELGSCGNGTCLFVMLNPSTATDTEDDPTIRKCMKYARNWGYQKLLVGNMFAYRSTDPRALKKAADPVGPDNDEWIQRMADEADFIVAAWGRNADDFPARSTQLRQLLGDKAHCLKLTANGQPWHPLYVRDDQRPQPMALAPAQPVNDNESGGKTNG